MKRLLSLITALAAFVGFANDTQPADADANTPTAESPLCVGFSFNNEALRTSAVNATSVTKDENGTVKATAYALEDTVWFYSEAQNAQSGEVENVFPFTVTETPTPDPNTEGGNPDGGAEGAGEAGGSEGGAEGGSAGGEDGNSSNAGIDDPVSPDSEGTSPDTGSEDDTTPATTAKPKIAWSSENVYATKATYQSGSTFLDGYLDDGGNGVKITVSNFAHKYQNSTYDVIIYFATDTANVAFTAPTVNGKQYTFDAENPERAKEGNANFGHSSQLSGQTQYGVNALRVCGLTGDLGITNAVPANKSVARSCIAAFQIVPAGYTAPTLTIGGAGKETVNWSTTDNWTTNTVITTNTHARIHLEGDATLTLDSDVSIANLFVKGNHTLTLKSADTPKACSFAFVSSLDATLSLADQASTTNVNVNNVRMPITIKAKADESHIPFTSRSYPPLTFAGGAGTAASPVSYTCAGGYLTLKGEGENNTPFYIADAANKTFSASGTTVTFDGAKVEYKGSDARFSVGNAAFTLTNATVTAQSLWLSQGENNRNARLTLDGTTVLTVTGTTDIDKNSASVMFGHWNGPSTFTLNGESQFLVSSQVLVGKTGNNHTININGGLFSANGIALAGNASGNNTLNLRGGTLALGAVGLTSYPYNPNSVNNQEQAIDTSRPMRSMAVSVTGDTTLRAKATEFPIWHPVTVAADKTLTLSKTNDTSVASTTYKFHKSISGEGTILVKQGVNVQFGTARPKKLKVEDATSTTIHFTLSTESGEEAVIQCEGLTSLDNVKIYQPDGQTLAGTATFAEFNADKTTLTIKSWQTLNCEADGVISFEDTTKWSGASSSAVPSSGDIIIKTVAGKTCTVTVGSNHSYGTIYVIGTGTVVLKGAGVLTPSGNVTVRTGAKLTLESASVIAEGKTLNLLSDSTLAILDLPSTDQSSPAKFKNVISGAGRVETFGDVQFTKNSSFTGGLTIKRGTASVEGESVKKGFGGANDDNVAGLIVVENGGCLDLAKVINRSYSLTIAGMGVATTNENGKVTYSGAVKNSKSGLAYNKTQTKSLTLSADALITADPGNEWGILASGWGATTLNFAGHTLTKQGAGEFFLSNVQTSSAGVLAIKEGKLTIYYPNYQNKGGPSTLRDTKLFLFGNSTLDLVTNLNGLNQLRFCPSAGGVTVNNINLLAASTQKILSGAGFEGNKMTAKDGTVVLVKGTANTITNGFLSSVSLGGRFAKTADNPSTFALDYNTEGTQLTATLQAPTKFFHYDFNNANASQTASKASDSVYEFGGWGDKGGSGPFIVNKGRSGKSGNFFFKDNNNRQTPYWDSTTASSGALDSCGALTVTTVARLMCASRTNGNVPLWCLGTLTTQNGSSLIGLVAIDSQTVAAVAVDSTSGPGSAMRELARVTGIKNLTTAFHFFALVVTGEESRLYVDRMPPAVSVGARAPLNAMANKGQIGAFHGGSNAYPRLSNGDGGFYLDDFQVYDAILSDKEIQELRRKFCPDPFFMIVQ